MFRRIPSHPHETCDSSKVGTASRLGADNHIRLKEAVELMLHIDIRRDACAKCSFQASVWKVRGEIE